MEMQVPDKLLDAAENAALTLAGVYAFVDQINALGGATNIQGVAKCHAFLKSLNANRSRVEVLVMAPLREAIADARK